METNENSNIKPVLAVLKLILFCACALLVACSGSDPAPTQQRRDCGLPRPDQDALDADVPTAFLPVNETEVVEARPREDRLIVTLDVPVSVEDSFQTYRQSVERAGFEILLKDFEGFEAELYLRKDKYLAVVEIRASDCNDAAVVRLNLPGERS